MSYGTKYRVNQEIQKLNNRTLRQQQNVRSHFEIFVNMFSDFVSLSLLAFGL